MIAMSSVKKILTVGAITFGGLMVFGAKKYQEAKKVMDNLKVGLKSVSNFKFRLSNTTFDAVFSLQNPTNINFGATLTSKIKIKGIRVYTKQGKFIGRADTNLYEIDLPANTTVDLPQATFNLNAQEAINEFLNHLSAYLSNDFSNLSYKVDVEVFGNILTLEA